MTNKDAGTILIAIAGGSCSGKTLLAGEVAARLGSGSNVIVIALDSYYRDLSDVAAASRGAHNFDHPDSIDLDLFERDLASLVSGGGALIPVYDYATHTRAPREAWRSIDPRSADAARCVIAEGLHVLHRKSTRILYDLSVFIDIDLDTCLRRRIERDVRERGRTPGSVAEQFDATVVPMYEEFVLPCRRYADLVIDGKMPPDRLATEVITAFGRRAG